MEVRRDPLSGLVTSKKLFNAEVKYFCDRAGRLLGRSDKASGKPFSSYQYDKNGNRILSEENDVTQSATYDDQDRLLSFGTNTYSYNANGNISSKVDGSLRLTHYIYDSDGTLAAVNMPEKNVEYGTDHEGRRIEKKINGVKLENYIWDGLLRLVAITNASGVIQKKFIYSDGHAPDYMLDAQGNTYLFVTDHRGSVVGVLNANNGQIVQSIEYTEWGAVVSDSNPGFQPFGFAGGLNDRDTGLVRFGARDYDPEIGRWTSKDPILFNGGDTNLFGYVQNDPVNFIDPSGKLFENIIAKYTTPKQQAAIGAATGVIGAALMYGSFNPFAGVTFSIGAYLGYEGSANVIKASKRGFVNDIMDDIIPRAEAGEKTCPPGN
ncbi:MAG: RHS repeat-associated core domain-containing protein [Bdellovibrio sp.]|nr:RHS repeat-associated core domain-containing protein [Bdellovibrio sp.]